jgi:hypothetical protein
LVTVEPGHEPGGARPSSTTGKTRDSSTEAVAVTKAYDLTLWLLPTTRSDAAALRSPPSRP